MNLPSKQRGLGWFGLLIMFGAIGFTVLVAMKCWPIYLNEIKVARAVKAAAGEAAGGADSVRRALNRYWDVDDIEYLRFQDVKLTSSIKGQRVLAYDYWAQTNLFTNVFVSFHFVKETPVSSSSGE